MTQHTSTKILGVFVWVVAACSGGQHGNTADSRHPDRARVPAGPFVMGVNDAGLERVVELCRAAASNPDRCNRERLIEHHRNETPQREVLVEAFWIDRYEVTNAAYNSCVDAGACTAPDRDGCLVASGAEPIDALDEARVRADHPVVCVSWTQADEFCRWRKAQLPTEPQWEKAARGTDGRTFPWGNEWSDRRANWSEDGAIDGYITTAPVGAFPDGASPYGALDMAGNVWEWVASAGTQTRFMRGGGYAAKPLAMRTTKRVPRDPPAGYENIGFRCAGAGVR